MIFFSFTSSQSPNTSLSVFTRFVCFDKVTGCVGLLRGLAREWLRGGEAEATVLREWLRGAFESQPHCTGPWQSLYQFLSIIAFSEQVCFQRLDVWVCWEGWQGNDWERPRSQRRQTASRCRPTHMTMTHSSLWVRGGRTVDLSGGFAQSFAFTVHHKKFQPAPTPITLLWIYHQIVK